MNISKIKFVWKCRECKSEYPEDQEDLPKYVNPSGIEGVKCFCGGMLDLCSTKNTDHACQESVENKLPEIGEWFEFDYTFRDEKTEVVKLKVVDVTDEHVMYKMPSVSVNKIFPMTHEYWLLNQEARRPCPKEVVSE